MIKTNLESMMAVYLKPFNTILKTSLMANNWCSGLTSTPIYKSGAISDPNNYWGICVSSCLGKRFCLILNQTIKTEDYMVIKYPEHITSVSKFWFWKKNRTADHV